MSGFFTKRHGKLETLDGNGDVIFDWTAEGVEINGVQLGGAEEGDRAATPLMQRGAFIGAEEGDDTSRTLSWAFRIKRAALTNAVTATALDVILGTGAASGVVNANPIDDGPLMLGTRVSYTKNATTGGYTCGAGRYQLSGVQDDGETVTGNCEVTFWGLTPF